ncbi:aldose epimerase family protein [Allorhizocola rhizosphaerae]|uniref:aldose epimerase family protein n=1 Tax=Allorhizocola rhizosphaerae TaxID=1872709 RepID=UPI000E3CD34B|nr:aldose epimerase family protein [Allorhizocola rhizosphaerae]
MRTLFGKTSAGAPVHRHTIGSGTIELELLDLGAAVHTLHVTCPDGVRRNVVLGHPDVEGRLASKAYIGATIGRFANRIAGGTFTLDGVEYRLAPNEGSNTLHGGPDGFDRRVWEVLEHTPSRIVFGLESPDGDQGFPGRVEVTAAYTVTGDTVGLEYTARTDAPTIVSLTNHAYFNLDGEDARTIDGHTLTVPSEHYIPTGPNLIPTGKVAEVARTPFDLRQGHVLGGVIRRPHPHIVAANGFDHNFVVPPGDGMRAAATLHSRQSGLTLTVVTDRPGVQVYTGNFLDGTIVGTSGALYRQGAGICLETQHYPDAPNQAHFPSPILRPGELMRSETRWHFGPVTG